jgi:hypothetical protein
MLALAVGLARFARALAGFLLAVVRETRGTPDPITMVPRVLRDAPTVPMPERMRDEARTGSGEH